MNEFEPEYGSPEHAAVIAGHRFPAVADAMQWLTYTHLPAALQAFSAPFYSAAANLLNAFPQDVPELTHALNGLIAAKDWGVRAGIRASTGRAGSVPRPPS